MTLRDRFYQLILALVFLTRLPLGRLLPEREVPLASALWAFPLAGVVVGAISALPLVLWGTSLVTATLSVILAVWITGGLHEDGLADFTDGMGGHTREDRLRIMRDPAVGSYGALAMMLSLMLRIVSIAALGPCALIGAATFSRATIVLALAVLPPAREDGLGHAAQGAARGQSLVAGAIGLMALLPLGDAGLAALIGGLVGAGLVIRQARIRLGGQTGDVLGSTSIVTETAALAAMALVPR